MSQQSKKIDANQPERRDVQTTMKIEKRAAENGGDLAIIEGYAAKFNEVTTIGGWFREVVRPGFFDEVLNQDVRCLKNHDPNYILARSNDGNGTLSLSVDDVGLKYSYTTPDISYARDLQKSIELGDVSQSSFSFYPKEVKWTEKEGELDLRELIKCETLYDVSPVTFPAYNNTEVAKRSWEAHLQEKEKETETRNIDVEGEEIKVLDEYEARHKFNQNKYKQWNDPMF